MVKKDTPKTRASRTLFQNIVAVAVVAAATAVGSIVIDVDRVFEGAYWLEMLSLVFVAAIGAVVAYIQKLVDERHERDQAKTSTFDALNFPSEFDAPCESPVQAERRGRHGNY